jgi:hypothetical protein
MKHNIYILLLAITLGFTQCDKEKPNNIPELPPATQTGANTLGFLLNGVPWKPEGNNGTPNLSISLDTGVNSNRFIIQAYKLFPSNYSEFQISFRADNLAIFPVITNPFPIGFVLFKDQFNCKRSTNDLSNYSSTNISISKNDKTNRIISGIFDCTMFNPACGDTIKITEGRFDMKF